MGKLNTSSEVGFPLWSLILGEKLSGFHYWNNVSLLNIEKHMIILGN